MADYVRRLVSGNKARFKDGQLNLELDLVYITDSVIVMGYPAIGIEGLYRNRREDALKFLTHRHGTNFWVFNFCPAMENSYPSSVFGGRVSRYPFPDHHVPPLALLALATREMHVWLQGSSDRVIVLHCKAGKGRSGTLACAYLLSLDGPPTLPRLERSYSAKQWATVRAAKLMRAMPDDDATVEINAKEQAVLETKPNLPTRKNYDSDETGLLKPPSPTKGRPRSDSPRSMTPPSGSSSSTSIQGQGSTAKSLSDPLKNVLDLHASRRMKASSGDTKLKQGVSIPSQRRWLYYWSLLLAHQGPIDFWPLSPGPDISVPKVRITQIKVRMKEMSSLKMTIVKAANLVIGRTGKGKGSDNGRLWASLARYDDKLVDTLETRERHTRGEGGYFGKRKQGSEHGDGEELADLFAYQKWDKDKMVRRFARMGTVGGSSIQKECLETDGNIISHLLCSLTDAKWASFCSNIQQDAPELPGGVSEVNSIADLSQTLNTDDGIVVDAGREVCVKLYLGQVLMGWLWFIPAFHMPHPRSSTQGATHFLLTRKELDFPLGVGSAIVDVDISLEACEEVEPKIVQPPARQANQESRDDGMGELACITTAQPTTAGGVVEAVEAKQAAEN